MALSINDIKVGMTILVEGGVWMTTDCQHVKPGKGAAFVRVKMRHLKAGTIQERTFRGDEKIEEAYVEERSLQYQYASGALYHFMDQETFEEIAISEDQMGEKRQFLKDNGDVTAFFYNNEFLYITLPNFIQVKVTNSEPAVRGDTAKAGTKPVTIETGAIIQVPLFISEGDTVKVDTRTGTYVERVG